MRMFTVYPQQHNDTSAPGFSIRAVYTEPGRRRRFGSLQVCSGWPMERVLDKFRRLGRAEAVARLTEELAAGLAVSLEMSRQELALWNSV